MTLRAAAARPAASVAAALAATLLFALWRALAADPATEGLERRLLDIRFQVRGPWAETDAAAIVAVDEATLQAHRGQSALRAALARAIPRILAQDPAALAIDLMFVDEMPSDPELAAALAGDRRAILAAAGMDAGAPGGPGGPLHPDTAAALDRSAIPVVVGSGSSAAQTRPFLLPNPTLARAARVAHVNVARDADRVARAAPLALTGPGGRELPSLALAAAATAARERLQLRADEVRMGARRIALDPARRVVIDHPGGPEVFGVQSLLAVVEGRAPPEAFGGRMVFVGATAPSLRDVFVTPFGSDVPGVVVLAGLATGLLEGRVIRRDAATAAVSLALAAALCAGALAAAAVASNAGALAAGAAVWAAGLGALQAGFAGAGWWLDATTVLFGLLAGTAAGAERRYRLSRREASTMGRERANLARFVAPALAERLARGGPKAIGRRMQPAAVLFADVAGFTALSERASPERTADFLAALHALFEAEAAARGGVVVDYQGDGAMIVFGLPDPAPDDAARALACARALRDGAAALAEQAPDGAPPRIRASVHHGPVALAVLGGRRQAVVSVAGDTVNLASRLQEAAKACGADLVASREALEAAGLAESAEAETEGYVRLARMPVRGRSSEVEVWAVRQPSATGRDGPGGSARLPTPP